jgi:hypothetical protein
MLISPGSVADSSRELGTDGNAEREEIAPHVRGRAARLRHVLDGTQHYAWRRRQTVSPLEDSSVRGFAIRKSRPLATLSRVMNTFSGDLVTVGMCGQGPNKICAGAT